MKFTEINYQGNLKGTDYMWGVHVAGCADIERECKRRFGRRWTDEDAKYVLYEHEATTMRELLDSIIDSETRELGWHDDNVKVHNCVTKALKGSGAAATASKKESTTMSAAGTKIAKSSAVKSTKTQKTPSHGGPVEAQARAKRTIAATKASERVVGKKIEDAKLKSLISSLVKSGKVTSKSGAVKAIRAQGIGVKGSRVRSMFIAINKSAKKSTK